MIYINWAMVLILVLIFYFFPISIALLKTYSFGCTGSLLLHAVFSSCRELELLSSCGAWNLSFWWLQWLWHRGLVALGHVESPGLEIQPMSCALAGRFWTIREVLQCF